MIDRDLMAAVDAYTPTGERRKEFRWANLWPYFSALRAKGCTVKEAINFLHTKGKIALGDFQKAENAFAGIATRKNKQAKANR